MTSPTPARTRARRLAALAAAALLPLGLAACGDDGQATDPASAEGDTGAGDGGSGGNGGDSGDSGDSGGEDGAGQVTVPVYFVGDTPQGPRLFREFRQVAGDPLEEAAALATTGDALDPDYRTAFPGGTFASVEYADGELRAVLPDDGWTTPGSLDSSEEAALAVQQLVYTLQGVQQERAEVVVYLGDSPTQLFGVDTADGVTNDPEVLAHVNVTAPEEGQTVSGTFTAEGVANSFEATVPWEIRRGEEVVLEGFSTAEGWMDKLYPWTTEVDVSGLEPGEYTFVAMTDDPSGGAEGAGPVEDSKTIRVE